MASGESRIRWAVRASARRRYQSASRDIAISFIYALGRAALPDLDSLRADACWPTYRYDNHTRLVKPALMTISDFDISHKADFVVRKVNIVLAQPTIGISTRALVRRMPIMNRHLAAYTAC